MTDGFMGPPWQADWRIMRVVPGRSTDPKGRHICLFDNGNGWLKYSFVRRTEDPQIVVEEVFWREADPLEFPTPLPAEE